MKKFLLNSWKIGCGFGFKLGGDGLFLSHISVYQVESGLSLTNLLITATSINVLRHRGCRTQILHKTDR